MIKPPSLDFTKILENLQKIYIDRIVYWFNNFRPYQKIHSLKLKNPWKLDVNLSIKSILSQPLFKVIL